MPNRFHHGDKEKRIFGNMQVEVPEACKDFYREWHRNMHQNSKEEHGIKVRNLSGNRRVYFESGFVGHLLFRSLCGTRSVG